MSYEISFEERLVHFLHETFPDSQDMSPDELKPVIRRLLNNAAGYGFSEEGTMAIYVTTAYLLGENFDTEFPAASGILTHPDYSEEEKANRLENWTHNLFEALEEGQHSPEGEPSAAAAPDAEADLSDYLTMEEQARPFRARVNWLVDRLIAGDAAAVIGQFSPNFMAQLGAETVARVFAEQMLPFFAGSAGLGNSCTVTRTHDAFGSEGFAFYLTIVSGEEEKPFVMYLVNEQGQLVLANLVLHKTYDDLHPA